MTDTTPLEQINAYMNPSGAVRAAQDEIRTNLRAIQDRINEDIKRLADASGIAPGLLVGSALRVHGFEHNTFTQRALPDYDDAWLAAAMPPRFIAGVDPGDVDPESLKPMVLWQDPVSVTVEARNVNLEMLEIMLGASLIPLCDRQIPAEGTE